MNTPRLDLNLLLTFEALMIEGQVTRAARRRHLSQPALSNSLARLRKLLGDPLFVHDGQRMVPTSRARELYAILDPALQQIRGALSGRAFAAENWLGTVRVIMTDDLEALVAPVCCTALACGTPGGRFVTRRPEGMFDLPVEELLAGSADFALGAFADPPAERLGISHLPLYVESIVCIARTDHPEIQGSISIEQFLRNPHISVQYPIEGIALLDRVLLAEKKRRRTVAVVSQVLSAIAVVSRSDTLACVPSQIARQMKAQMHLQILALPVATPQIKVGLYWHVRHETNPEHPWLRELLIESVQKTVASVPS